MITAELVNVAMEMDTFTFNNMCFMNRYRFSLEPTKRRYSPNVGDRVKINPQRLPMQDIGQYSDFIQEQWRGVIVSATFVSRRGNGNGPDAYVFKVKWDHDTDETDWSDDYLVHE